MKKHKKEKKKPSIKGFFLTTTRKKKAYVNNILKFYSKSRCSEAQKFFR